MLAPVGLIVLGLAAGLRPRWGLVWHWRGAVRSGRGGALFRRNRAPSTPEGGSEALSLPLAGDSVQQNLSDLAAYGCDASGCRVDGLEDEEETEEGEAEATAAEDNGQLRRPRRQRRLGVLRLLEDPSSEFASAEPAELRRFLARPADFAYEVAEVTALGAVRRLRMRRSDLLRLTHLRPRDLRAVAVQPSPGTGAGPILAGRQGTLLLGLGDVRAIVEPQRALVFGSATTDSTRFLRVLENQRRAAPESSFRMLVVESALLALSRKLGSRLLEVQEACEPRLRLGPTLLEPDLEEVRQQRRVLVRCASQASAVSSALLSRLDDGDLLPGALRDEPDQGTTTDASEWETMLEVYLLAYSGISRDCASLLSDIEDFEGSVSLTLQARRLRVEQFELSLVIGSVSLSASALLPGIFGMNLLSGEETTENAFGLAVVVTLSLCTSLFLGLRWLAASRGILN